MADGVADGMCFRWRLGETQRPVLAHMFQATATHNKRRVSMSAPDSVDLRGNCEIEDFRDLERTFRAIMRSKTLCHVIEKFRHQCSPNSDVS